MKTISKRCGFSKCEFYNPNNKISGCKIFEDRNDCNISLKKRKKVAVSSTKKQPIIQTKSR